MWLRAYDSWRAELDLLVFVGGERYGFEFKYADAPALSKSLQVAHDDLRLRRVFIVYPGQESYALSDWCDVVAIRDLRARLADFADRSKPQTARPKQRKRIA